MRHQRAAAGWSSGSGPAAAADRTSWVVSKPARERLLSLSLRPAGMGLRSLQGLLWRAAAAIADLYGYPGVRVACRVAVARLAQRGRAEVARLVAKSLESTWVAARHTCTSAMSLAGTGACRLAAQAGVSPAAWVRIWSAS